MKTPPRQGDGITARQSAVALFQQPAKLAAELVAIPSSEKALAWAIRTLPTKNTLLAEDARALEQAFEAKMAEFRTVEASEPASAEMPP